MNISISKTLIGRIVGGLAIAAIFASPVFAETATENYWDKMGAAQKQMEKGWAELDKMDQDLAKNKEGAANRALNSALSHFEKAAIDYAKAMTTKDQKDAVQDLKFGMDEYRKAVKALEEDNVGEAQAHYDTAQDYFDKAAAELWPDS